MGDSEWAVARDQKPGLTERDQKPGLTEQELYEKDEQGQIVDELARPYSFFWCLIHLDPYGMMTKSRAYRSAELLQKPPEQRLEATNEAVSATNDLMTAVGVIAALILSIIAPYLMDISSLSEEFDTVDDFLGFGDRLVHYTVFCCCVMASLFSVLATVLSVFHYVMLNGVMVMTSQKVYYLRECKLAMVEKTLVASLGFTLATAVTGSYRSYGSVGFVTLLSVTVVGVIFFNGFILYVFHITYKFSKNNYLEMAKQIVEKISDKKEREELEKNLHPDSLKALQNFQGGKGTHHDLGDVQHNKVHPISDINEEN